MGKRSAAPPTFCHAVEILPMHDDTWAGKWYTHIRPMMKVPLIGGSGRENVACALLRAVPGLAGVMLAGSFDRGSCAQFALAGIVPSP
jgi:hypothetical protein